MDHHCPWTANCVSHTTFPHFIRFLFYTSAGLGLLAYLQFTRIAHLWSQRNLPAYLGPSPWLVAHLFFSTCANAITLFAVFILLVRNIWCLAVNTTTIEGWEIERHRTLVRRARVFGGWLEGPDGERVRVEKREFPYDVGIWQNIKQGMGTGNPISWFNPFAPTPPLSTGLSFPTNGFEDASFSWPPPDPDRSYRRQPRQVPNYNDHNKADGASSTTATEEPFTYSDSTLSPAASMAAFRARQAADTVRRRAPFVQRMEAKMAQDRISSWDAGSQRNSDDTFGNRIEELGMSEDEEGGEEIFGHQAEKGGSEDGEEAWRNSEGERLKDFGVDEEVEFYDEQEDDDDDIPLSELLARKRAAAVEAESLYT
jgi:palmitoyltransferase